jgi:hypothetical protein
MMEDYAVKSTLVNLSTLYEKFHMESGNREIMTDLLLQKKPVATFP